MYVYVVLPFIADKACFSQRHLISVSCSGGHTFALPRDNVTHLTL